MSNLSERLATLDQEFKYAEACALYKNVCTQLQSVKNTNGTNSLTEQKRREQVAHHMTYVTGALASLRAVAPIPGRFDPTKCEEGELCLGDLLERLQPMADAWRGKAHHLYNEGKAPDWLNRFVGTATDALSTAWDRANGIKLL